jgi:hypothetical protein
MLSMRQLAYAAALLAALVVSFFLTLLWMGPPGGRMRTPENPTATLPDWQRLASRSVSSDRELGQAARDLGLESSTSMRGHIERVTRITDREVTMAGWLADSTDDPLPLKILVFVGGSMVVMAEPKEERPDVSQALGWAYGAQKKIGFQVKFNCRAGEQAVVAGLGAQREYVSLKSHPCP